MAKRNYEADANFVPDLDVFDAVDNEVRGVDFPEEIKRRAA
jgi:hypothetical protein